MVVEVEFELLGADGAFVDGVALLLLFACFLWPCFFFGVDDECVGVDAFGVVAVDEASASAKLADTARIKAVIMERFIMFSAGEGRAVRKRVSPKFDELYDWVVIER